LNGNPSAVINMSVQFFKAMLAILLALAWAPLTAHCQIESLVGLGLLSCQSAGEAPAPNGSHCDDSSCCAWESGQCSLPQNQPSHVVWLIAVALTVVPFALHNSPPADAGMEILTTAPPEITRIWQFSFRAALPVRAPTFPS
jgi:hypothetical protein